MTAGCSIEDYDPRTGSISALEAARRVAAAASAAQAHGLVLNARAENYLYGVGDLDDTIARLAAYCDAGAEVVYAPGLTDPEEIRQLVEKVKAPVNVLAFRHGPSIPELAALGVRRSVHRRQSGPCGLRSAGRRHPRAAVRRHVHLPRHGHPGQSAERGTQHPTATPWFSSRAHAREVPNVPTVPNARTPPSMAPTGYAAAMG